MYIYIRHMYVGVATFSFISRVIEAITPNNANQNFHWKTPI